MYEKFYGLRERAFNLTPDPAFLFLTKRSKDALEHILYGIERREGFAVIVGDVGTGKTTLCWALLDKLEKRNVRTALIQNPTLSETDLLKAILQDLGVRPEGIQPDEPAPGLKVFDGRWMHGMTKKELIDRLNLFLAERAREDVFTVLIIDESQNLSMEMLEQLRLLSNLETTKKKLLQIIFAGQLELETRLKLPALRQLNQRISVRFETGTLTCEETERYIRHRLIVAGGAPKLRYGRGVFKAVWRHSKGYPRLINLICDRTLLAGYGARSPVITRNMVRKAVLGLKGKEDVSPGGFSGWIRKMVPFFAPVVLLGLVLPFLSWRGPDSSRVPYASSPAHSAASAAASPTTGVPELPPARPPNEHPPDSDTHPAVQFFLQVHSFRTNAPAEAAIRELKRSGYPSYISYVGEQNGAGWFAVCAGPFNDQELARQKAAALRSQGFAPILRRQDNPSR